MAHQSELIARDIGAYLHAQEHKSLLRFHLRLGGRRQVDAHRTAAV